MKKLRLKALSLGASEILSRQQLRSIMGGCEVDGDCPGDTCNTFTHICNGGGSNDASGDPSIPCEGSLVHCSCTTGCYEPMDCDVIC